MRPRGEVDNLMFLLQELPGRGVRSPDGEWCAFERHRASGPIRVPRRSIAAEEHTSEGPSLHLRVAMDYSAREALLAAAGRVPKGHPDPPGVRAITL